MHECLSAKHKFDECTSKFHCRKCKQKHHTSICNSKEASPTHTETIQVNMSHEKPTHYLMKDLSVLSFHAKLLQKSAVYLFLKNHCVVTFGGNVSTSKPFDIVSVKLQRKQGDIKLNAIVMDTDLTTALLIQPRLCTLRLP